MENQHLIAVGSIVDAIGIAAGKNNPHVQLIGPLADLRKVLLAFYNFFHKGDDLSGRLRISFE
jgi:hypothetical protein